MQTILYQFSGHVKTAIPIFYHDNYDWEVVVYRDRAIIKRSGSMRASLSNETVVRFEDVSAIRCMGPDIKFHVKGMQSSSPLPIVTSKLSKNISVSSMPNSQDVWDLGDPYMIEGKDSNEMQKHCNELNKIYNAYRDNANNNLVTTNIKQESELDKMKKIKELFDLNIITKDEYEAKRKELLEKI